MKYRVWVCIETEKEVEANSEKDALEMVREMAISGDEWDYKVEEIEGGDKQ